MSPITTFAVSLMKDLLSHGTFWLLHGNLHCGCTEYVESEMPGYFFFRMLILARGTSRLGSGHLLGFS
jgi:hypothetical protein